MKARALLLTGLLGSTLWLFFTESGKRRRGQVMGMMGRGPAPDSTDSPAAPVEPLKFPQSPPHQEPAQPSPEVAAPAVPVSAAAQDTATAPSAALQSPAAAPTDQATPEQTVTPPDADATSEPYPTAGPDGTSVQIEEVNEGQGAESNARLEEVLQELVEEIETHAIGQEPDVKVEEELDQATLQEIGIADGPPAEADQPATAAAPAEPAPADTRWIGNRRKMIAHAPGSGRLPAEENRVYFATREEAAAAGYRVVEQEER